MTWIFLVGFVIIAVILGVGYLLRSLRDIDETNKKIAWAEKRHYTLLRVMAPKNNEKTPLAAEQMFAALHGIYRKEEVLQEHFSFEIAAVGHSIHFYLLVPTHLRDFLEGQIYSQYPTVEIEAVNDYANIDMEGKAVVGGEIGLIRNDYFPIRTFVNFDVDPLAGITGVLSKIEDGEVLAVQAVMSPIDDSWQKEGLSYVKNVKEGKPTGPPPPLRQEFGKQSVGLVKEVGKGILSGIVGGGGGGDVKKEEKKEIRLSGPEEIALKGIETKVTKLGYAMSVRVLAVTPDEALSRTRMESVAGAFKQFNLTNLNGFDISATTIDDPNFLKLYRSRNLSGAPYRMNVEEIASVFHFPDTSVETPNIVWAGSKKGETPQNLPVEGEIPASELTTLGLSSFRNRRTKFGIKRLDRRLHFYAIGKTGTGKSTLIENMIYDDIKEGRGVAVVDPHGELIEHILNFIPEDRIEDVVYFNPDDRENPLAFNLLESVEGDMRSIVASGLMSIFTKLWANVWSARMEYILRNAILAVLEVPDATLLSIMRVLNDPMYRKYVLSFVSDPVVKDFFVNEYDKYDAKFRQEAIAPIQNKVGQFLSSSTIRNLVGQPKSTFDLNDIMDSGKIFLVNLSIGRIGEDNSKLLGSMMITKIQLAAMERARISEDERRDFYLYVDEFQNFATDSFATILSEARKYHLNLVLVNQYIAQIPEVVADAIFGNVGTMVSFRVGATDADKLVKEFEPVFDANDLINLPNRQIYIKMAIDGVTSRAFSAHTLPPRGVISDNIAAILKRSREKYARSRNTVEAEINALAMNEFKPEADQKYDELRQNPLVINGTLYKEFSAKGGQRWYFGQPPEVEDPELAQTNKTDVPDVVPAEKRVIQTVPAPVMTETKLDPATSHEILPSTEVVNTNIIPQEPTSNSKRKRKRKGRGEQAASNHDVPNSMLQQGRVTEKAGDNTAGDFRVEHQGINRGHQADDWMPIDEAER